MSNLKSKAIMQTNSVTWSKFKRWNIKGEVEGIFTEEKSHGNDSLDIEEEEKKIQYGTKLSKYVDCSTFSIARYVGC